MKKPIREKEFECIMRCLVNDSLSDVKKTKLKRLFTVLYVTGLRINEAASLTYGQLRDGLHRQEMLLKTSKTGAWRRIFLSRDAAIALESVFCGDLDTMPDDVYLFHPRHRRYSMPSIDRLTKDANEYLKKVLGPGYTSHSFRSGVITDMVAKTGNIKIAQEYIAHKSASTTLRYVRPSEDDIRAGLAR